MFTESYQTETQVLLEKASLFKDFIAMQKEIEKNENEQLQHFLELKLRKMQEAQAEFWSVSEQA